MSMVLVRRPARQAAVIARGRQAALFAAAFGSQQPVASNADAAGRALNRRVEMAPTPKPRAP